ncbi:hypothetical protein OIE66_34950 [Nonomuraea sp. NBC_01738]|uniref:hypothetical protein n=1 Tax=Nonomuraea sp. NBC_01738 TaxID=2976003 RepID=UPI002E0DDA9B|nr:hypothetical protein OIE66_34950 [Nonomuraea sp. NBC_01738]
MSVEKSSDGSMNPLNWSWTDWNFKVDFGSLLNPMPLYYTIKSMVLGMPTLFGADGGEARLRSAAGAHEQLAANLEKVFQVLDGKTQATDSGYLDKIVKEWRGEAADNFRKVWGEVVKHDNRVALQQSGPKVAEVLRSVANTVALTKAALSELLWTAGIWFASFWALRWLMSTPHGRIAAFLAYLRTTRIVAAAARLVAHFMNAMRWIGGLMSKIPLLRRLSVAGRLAVPKARPALSMTKAELQAMTKTNYAKFAEKVGTTTFSSYAKLSGSVFAGIIGTQMAAQGMSGNSIFNLSPVTFTQAAHITTFATAAGSFTPIAGMFRKGLLQGGGAASWAATTTKTGAAVGESGIAFGSFVGVRNWTYDRVKGSLPFAGKNGPGNVHKQFWQGIPTSFFRVWRPLNTPEAPPDLPDWQRPPTHEQPTQPSGATNLQSVTPSRYGYMTAGDGSLQELARKVYGDANRWPEIYTANRDAIGDDPRAVKRGQLLKIPMYDDEEGAA